MVQILHSVELLLQVVVGSKSQCRPNVGGSGGGGAGIHGPSQGAKGNPSDYFQAEGSDGFRTGGPNNCGDGGSFLQADNNYS